MTITSPVAYTPKQIERLGSLVHYWQRGGSPERFYLDWEGLVGLEVNYYKSGMVCSAVLQGDGLSNTKAAHLLRARAWFDEQGHLVTTLDEFQDRVTGLDLVARLHAAVADLMVRQ